MLHFADSLPRCLYWLLLGQAKARSVTRPSSSSAFPDTRVSRELGEGLSSWNLGCQLCKQLLNLMPHHTSTYIYFMLLLKILVYVSSLIVARSLVSLMLLSILCAVDLTC